MARPNFVLVILDDANVVQMRRTLPLARRKLSDLGAKALDFQNAFLTTPLCCPSRASILTGDYAHTTGIHFNNGPEGGADTFAANGKDKDTIATRLKTVGYVTGLVGKYLNGYEKMPGPYVPPGWDYWRALHDLGTGGYLGYKIATESGNLIQYGTADADYSTDVLKQWAIRFLRKAEGRPFFLVVAPIAPHEPAIPATRHQNTHPDLAGAPRPPNYANPADKLKKPAWVQGLSWPPSLEAEDDAFYINQAKTLDAVDEMLRDLAEKLATGGAFDDTVFLVLSDNGYAHGEHFWKGKGFEYDPAVRTSLGIVSKNFVAASGVRAQIAGNIDLAPTIAELAGYVHDEPLGGVSLVEAMTSPDKRPRADLLIERKSKNPSGAGTPANPIPTWDGVVAERGDSIWKYVELAGGALGRELYDLVKDPFELSNVIEDPVNARLAAELESRVEELKTA